MAAAHHLAYGSQRLRQPIVELLVTTIATDSHRGESHGGAYLVDLEKQSARQAVDWNTTEIDWQRRHRGLRGIAFDGERLFIAASDRLLAYSLDFEPMGSWENRYLAHCQDIFVWERTLYLASSGFDTILGFHLDECRFHWGMHVKSAHFQYKPVLFDPSGDDGPLMVSKLHLNSVYCSEHGMYVTGLKTGGMLHFNGRHLRMSVELPQGTHNARPFRDGVLFNDAEAGALRYSGRGEGAEDRAMAIPSDSQSSSARGLCVVSDNIVAGGSAPATIAIYDLASNQALGSVSLTRDPLSSIHSLAVWPY